MLPKARDNKGWQQNAMVFLHPELHLMLHPIPFTQIPDGTGFFRLQMKNYREGKINNGTKELGADRPRISLCLY